MFFPRFLNQILNQEAPKVTVVGVATGVSGVVVTVATCVTTPEGRPGLVLCAIEKLTAPSSNSITNLKILMLQQSPVVYLIIPLFSGIGIIFSHLAPL